VEAEVAHRDLADLRVTASMHERKALMADLADGFVALPGGFGTIEEFVEVLTWSQLGLHDPPKPCGLLDVRGFYGSLLAQFARAADQRFLRPQHLALVLAADAPGPLLDALAAWEAPPPVRKWTDPV
jgi:uncharacterized protein (TIGR00730 family)